MISGDHSKLSSLMKCYMYDLNSWKVKVPQYSLAVQRLYECFKEITATVFGNINEGGFLKGFVS